MAPLASAAHAALAARAARAARAVSAARAPVLTAFRGALRGTPLGALLPALLATLLATGCRIHSVDPEPPPPVELPETFSATGDEPLPDRWWESFGDPELEGLVRQTLAGNLDLRAAWARLEQADAVWRVSRAGLFPAIGVTAEASRSRRTFAVGGPVGTVTPESDLYTLSVGASYELDLWGRIASQMDAATLDFAATRDDIESLAMTLAARVAETWYGLLEARAQRRLLDDQIAVSRTFLDLVTLRFAQGQASALEVYQQRQQVGSLEATIPAADESTALLEHGLAVIAGKAPGSFDVPPDTSGLPEVPALPSVVAPGELLARRPDLRAARRRVVAADHRLASSIADLLPAIRLTGQTGGQSTEIADIFQSWMYNLAGSIAAPIFEGGRRRAEVQRSRAVVAERLEAFGQVLLTSVREVEDALVQERKRRELAAALDRQLEVAEANLREARMRYVNGLTDYLNVLAALSTFQNLQRSRLQAGREIVVRRIQLHRALGGSWPSELAPPPSRDEGARDRDRKSVV